MNIFFVLLLFIQSLFGGSTNLNSYVNDGPSMQPTIYDGDRMIVNTDITIGINRNDLIVFKTDEKSFIKRVIGISGDQIQLNEKGIYVNNRLYKKTINFGYSETKITLKENEYYVVGDNVDNSYDSRSYGPIKEEQIIGRVIKILHMHIQ